MSRSDKDLPRGDTHVKKNAEKALDSVELELDTQQLRALDPTAQDESLDNTATQRELIDTATNLELSQSIDDLRNLSWPLWKPRQ